MRTCSACGGKAKPLPSRSIITDLPAVMPVFVPRQNTNGEKIKTPVRVDPTVLMEFTNKGGQQMLAAYEHYGTVCHQGETLGSGHYFAQVSSNDTNVKPTWLTCNDALVTQTTDGERRFAHANAAMVFYRLKRPLPSA